MCLAAILQRQVQSDEEKHSQQWWCWSLQQPSGLPELQSESDWQLAEKGRQRSGKYENIEYVSRNLCGNSNQRVKKSIINEIHMTNVNSSCGK